MNISLLIPICGIIISNVQQISPIKTVLKARKARNLGPFNPVPVAFMLVNLMGWAVYSCALGDFLLLLSCFAGVLVNCLMFTTAVALLSLQPEREKEVIRMEAILLIGILVWGFLGLLNASVISTEDTLNVMGLLASSTTIMYYASPLSALVAIFRTKSTKSLYMPQIAMNFVSVLLWMSYGYSQNNIYIWLPSFVGFWVTLLQFILKLYFYLTKGSRMIKEHSTHSFTDDSICHSLHPMSDFIMTSDPDLTLGSIFTTDPPFIEMSHAPSSDNLLGYEGVVDDSGDLENRGEGEKEEVPQVPYFSALDSTDDGRSSIYSDISSIDPPSTLEHFSDSKDLERNNVSNASAQDTLLSHHDTTIASSTYNSDEVSKRNRILSSSEDDEDDVGFAFGS
jgi:uncharacterized protein with PQ loop repeat